MKRKLTSIRGRRIRQDNDENHEEVMPLSVWEGAGESPNRILLPRKIGRRRPEDERGYKPTVI